MTQVQTQNQSSASNGPERPQSTESTPTPGIREPNEDGLGDYDANIVQLSDTETEGVPVDEILNKYDEGDVDAFLHAGDASKKTLDPASYLGQFEDTYEDLATIKDELNTEVIVEPGNHEPIKGSHTAGGWAGAADDEDYVEQVEDILGEHYEEFKDTDANAFEFLADEYDLNNIEYDSVELGDLNIVGGTHHDGELKVEREWLEETPSLDDLDYDAEELSEKIEFRNDYNGILSDLPLIGDIFSQLLGSTENPEPEDLSLEDIPSDYEKTTKHEDYEEALDLLNYFENAIESTDNDVFLTHHGIISSLDEEYGSVVADYVTEQYDLAGFGGGHSGLPQVDDAYGVPAVSTNQGAVIEMGFNEGELKHLDSVVKPETDHQGSPEVSERGALARINQQMAEIDENGLEAFMPNREEIMGEDATEEEMIEAAQVEQRRELLQEAYETYKEEGEFESMEEFNETISAEEAEPPVPQQPETPEQPGRPAKSDGRANAEA